MKKSVKLTLALTLLNLLEGPLTECTKHWLATPPHVQGSRPEPKKMSYSFTFTREICQDQKPAPSH